MLMPKSFLLLLSFAAFLFITSDRVEGSSRKVEDKDKEGEELLLLKRVSELLINLFFTILILFHSFVMLVSCELCASNYAIPVARGQFGLFLNHDTVVLHIVKLSSSFSKITAIYKKTEKCM